MLEEASTDYYYYYYYITFMQGIYNYRSDTNRVSRVNNVAAVLYLQFLHMQLHFAQ
jgi:hypothetical protein